MYVSWPDFDLEAESVGVSFVEVISIEGTLSVW